MSLDHLPVNIFYYFRVEVIKEPEYKMLEGLFNMTDLWENALFLGLLVSSNIKYQIFYFRLLKIIQAK